MANPEHLAMLKKGADVWNRWRRQNPKVQPDLRGAPLVSARLSGCILSQSILREANLRSAEMVAVDLRHSDLRGADLDGADISFKLLDSAGPRFEFHYSQTKSADLSWSDFSDARLTGVDFLGARLMHTKLCGADLSRANLANVQLQGADFSGARLRETAFDTATFGGTQLGTAKELEHCRFLGPSYLDHRTIMKSWPMPVSFLRGCGLSDLEIELAKLYDESLSDSDITDTIYRIHGLRSSSSLQFYSCFISYGSADENFAKCLHTDLQKHGVRCWFAPEDMKIGERIRPSLDESIRLYDKLLLILSKTSLASQWIEQEVESALEKERRENTTVLFPIRLDDAVMDAEGGWPQLIRNTRHIGDFTNWKDHDDYRKAFERLLRDLKAEKPVVED